MWPNNTVIVCVVLIFLSACGAPKSEIDNSVSSGTSETTLKGTITVTGAYALYPLASKWAEDFMNLNPEVKIEILKTGTGQGIEDLISKKCQIAMISRPLTDQEITSGVWVIPVAKDGVAPIVSQKNPYLKKILKRGLSTDEFIKIFTGESSVTWGELLDTTSRETVIPYSREDESGAEEVWAGFLYKRTEEIKGQKVTGDEEMIKTIGENPFSIGFCNFSFAFNTKTGEKLEEIQIVPFDLNFDNTIKSREIPFTNLEKAHRGLWLGLYPKILCRELTMGTIGKPNDELTVAFIRYALTRGQEDIKIVGLCELNDVYVRYSLELLK